MIVLLEVLPDAFPERISISVGFRKSDLLGFQRGILRRIGAESKIRETE